MKNRHYSVNIIFMLLLLCVFAICILLSLGMGARIYQSMNTAADESFAHRTCLSYITTKVRQGDSEGEVSVGEFGDSNALFITEFYEDLMFQTVIYVLDGKLMELFYDYDLNLGPEDGTAILDIISLELSLSDDGLLHILCETEGSILNEAYIYLRSEGSVA